MILKGESAEEFNRRADENYEKHKAKQKQALIDMMKADEKDGLYDETDHTLSADANRKRLEESITQMSEPAISYPVSLRNVNRVEVIDQDGRSYVNRNDKNVVEIDFQDDGKTMKIFISQTKEVDTVLATTGKRKECGCGTGKSIGAVCRGCGGVTRSSTPRKRNP